MLSHLALIRVDTPVLKRAAELGPQSLRSLDAIHLATALSITPEIDALVTYDGRLRDVALENGLQVEAPSKL